MGWAQAWGLVAGYGQCVPACWFYREAHNTQVKSKPHLVSALEADDYNYLFVHRRERNIPGNKQKAPVRVM